MDNKSIPGYEQFARALHSFYQSLGVNKSMQEVEIIVNKRLLECTNASMMYQKLLQLTQKLAHKYNDRLHLSASGYFRWDEHKRPATNAFKELQNSAYYISKETKRRQLLGLAENANENQCQEVEERQRYEKEQLARRQQLHLSAGASEQDCKIAEQELVQEKERQLLAIQLENERQQTVDQSMIQDIIALCYDRIVGLLNTPGNHTKDILDLLDVAGEDIGEYAKSLILDQINILCLTYASKIKKLEARKRRYSYESRTVADDVTYGLELSSELVPLDEYLNQHIYVRIEQLIKYAH